MTNELDTYLIDWCDCFAVANAAEAVHDRNSLTWVAHIISANRFRASLSLFSIQIKRYRFRAPVETHILVIACNQLIDFRSFECARNAFTLNTRKSWSWTYTSDLPSREWIIFVEHSTKWTSNQWFYWKFGLVAVENNRQKLEKYQQIRISFQVKLLRVRFSSVMSSNFVVGVNFVGRPVL